MATAIIAAVGSACTTAMFGDARQQAPVDARAGLAEAGQPFLQHFRLSVPLFWLVLVSPLVRNWAGGPVAPAPY